tara:strand:- start:47 stop:208 length:162 start_codon:yes stop_codon:yes gene_type:complete
MTYKLQKNEDGIVAFVLKTEGKRKEFIPFNDELGSYQEYLEWVAEGNTPDPAD